MAEPADQLLAAAPVNQVVMFRDASKASRDWPALCYIATVNAIGADPMAISDQVAGICHDAWSDANTLPRYGMRAITAGPSDRTSSAVQGTNGRKAPSPKEMARLIHQRRTPKEST